MAEHDLESLYREAQSALKSRDYIRASTLLRQILVIDENYKDVSRLLAQIVKLRRRRWYNDPRLWGALGFLVIVALGFFVAPRLKGMYAVQPSVVITDTISPRATLQPTISPMATQTLLPTPTPIPLTWNRISVGQDFERDMVSAFASDKKDSDVIYAAMKNAGVYKTIDGGLSWRPAHHGLASTQVVSLLIDSHDSQILYAGTIGGIFKTEDGGENWSRVGNGTYLLMDLQDNSHLYARDENGIYETKDQGNNWTSVYVLKKDCPNEIYSWAIHPADGKMLFIGGGETCAGVYQSSDSGRNWTLIGMEDKPNLDALAIGLDEQGNFSIYASIYAQHVSLLGADLHGVYTSHDGGSSWSKSEGAFGCNILAFDTDSPGVIYCGGTSPKSLLITKGKGNPWKAIPGSYSKVYTAIHIDHPKGINRIITGGTDVSTTSDPNIGIFISEDGGISWAQRDNGLGSTRAELKIDPLDSARIYLATYFGEFDSTNSFAKCLLYRSLDSGKSWPLIKWRNGRWCGPTFDAAHVLYMNEGGKLQKSWNGGDTWLWDSQGKGMGGYIGGNLIDKTIAYALPSYFGEYSQSVSASPYAEGFIYDVGNVIYYSTDSGASWQLSAGSEGSWDARLFYTDQSKMIYAIGRYHQAYSTDNGKTWQTCREDVTTSRSDTRLALDLQGARIYLATPGQGVLINTDSCGSWQASNDGLSNLFVNTLAIDPNINTIYAGTDGGAYISYDGGQTWGQVNDGLLGATVVYSIVVDNESNVYAATPYGIFKLEGK